MDINKEQILSTLYDIEKRRLQFGEFDKWVTPEEVAAALPKSHEHYQDFLWAREQLVKLWIERKVLQVTHLSDIEDVSFQNIVLKDLDVHGISESNIKTEGNDCRGGNDNEYEQVALYPSNIQTRYRSRMAEIVRLLSRNYQRFNMSPTTGLLRYELYSQQRPERDKKIDKFENSYKAQILNGKLSIAIEGVEREFQIDTEIDRGQLAQAFSSVLRVLANYLGGAEACLSSFQIESIATTLGGLYCSSYKSRYSAHIVTAGVGSGKSFAFQIGTLVHIAYSALLKNKGIRVLLLYPRVALAGNQFKDLFNLVELLSDELGIELSPPCLDAGGQIQRQMGIDSMETGATFKAIQKAYNGDFSILISNLDTIANRLVHPESCAGITKDLDLIVIDEIHLLNGLYGAHAKMMIKRIELMRSIRSLRQRYKDWSFGKLLSRKSDVHSVYFIGASATISEPSQHTARIIDRDQSDVYHISEENPNETGWVHHLFLRQRYEASSMSALVNATSCLIHNRSNGLFRDYYESIDQELNTGISMDQLNNPILPDDNVRLRQSEHIHKTIGFSDSLDNVGRWADLVSDNEKTKSSEMSSTPNLTVNSFPYFLRFQEPLWRVIHHASFSRNPAVWQRKMREHYGIFCRDCKKGIKRSILRIPGNLSSAQKRRVDELWDTGSRASYLHRLGVGEELINTEWFLPVINASQNQYLKNIDECPFFQGCLCWWWSMDHAGNNASHPATYNNPLNGYKMPGRNPNQYYHNINGIRVSSFTSNTEFAVMALNTINDVFQRKANSVFRDMNFKIEHFENSALIIGSPRLEVGIDLSRVRDGITFQAMRDPASLQQKVGRVGREQSSDSIILHLVTQNTRDQYYFRNPHIALDTDYLQPIPMHENNRIVARHHYFMAVVDFLCLQGANPGNEAISDDAERLNLINDHKYNPSFANWSKKVTAVFEFLFGNHSMQIENLKNLKEYLKYIGAKPDDLSNPGEYDKLKTSEAPLNRKNLGVIDVFKHEFGPNFFLTPIQLGSLTTTLAEVCSYHQPAPFQKLPGLPRHEYFLRTYHTPPPKMNRSYLWQLMTLSLFKRGIPALDIPGDQPFVWAPNLFETVGNETVRIFEETTQGQNELGYVNVSMATSLLLPGTVTYRFRASPRKVPVSQISCQGQPSEFANLTQAVYLKTDQPKFFEETQDCPEITKEDLPGSFVGNAPVKVYTPRQIGVIPSRSEPFVTFSDGMMADDDSRPFNPDNALQIMAPPRAFALKWYRIKENQPSPIKCRFKEKFAPYAQGEKVISLPRPKVLSLFSSIDYDPQLEITEFAWGLDRQFPTRQSEAARLIYTNIENQSVALGHLYRAPGMIFTLNTLEGTAIDSFLDELFKEVNSGAHQSILLQVLNAFLSEHARIPLGPDRPPWEDSSRPSSFTVRDLRTIILFRLLEMWHPLPETNQKPTIPLLITIKDIVGCFTKGHVNYLDRSTFNRISSIIAITREVANPDQHIESLRSTYTNFQTACDKTSELNNKFYKKVSLEILANSLGLAMHSAALRLTGAEEDNLLYFYDITESKMKIFLFDRDAFGNGTTDLIKNYLFISSAERTILERLKVLGNTIDPLPTTDFVRCFEEELQECDSSQAAQLAFHDLPADNKCFERLEAGRRSESKIANRLFDFMKDNLSLTSFDHLIPFQVCPEFIAYISSTGEYPCHNNKKLVGSSNYPVYQSLESAMGFCISGCISCVISPEKNVTGSLTARETANSLLLNAFYLTQVCRPDDDLTKLCYPGTGPGRTTEWENLALVEASTKGKEIKFNPIILQLPVRDGSELQDVSVVPAMTPADWKRVFRVSWNPVTPPEKKVRLRMDY